MVHSMKFSVIKNNFFKRQVASALLKTVVQYMKAAMCMNNRSLNNLEKNTSFGGLGGDSVMLDSESTAHHCPTLPSGFYVAPYGNILQRP